MINESAHKKIANIKSQLKTVEERKFLDQMTELLEHLLEDNKKLRDAAAMASWRLSPDRMGGAVDDEELVRHYMNRW